MLLAGVALAATGGLRIARLGLRTMPVAVAVAAAIAGLTLAGIAAFWIISGPSQPSPRAAQLRLEPDAAIPEDAATGAVSGVVRTHHGTGMAGATVTLRRFDRTTPTGTQTTTTDGDGRYSFETLPAGPTSGYRVQTVFDGTTFGSKLLLVVPGATTTADLVVAPPTTDATVVELAVDSTVLLGDARGVEVLQITSVHNTSDRAFVGGLRLPLLARASGVDPRHGLDRSLLSFSDGDLVSHGPVLPGTTQIVYVYSVPLPRSGLSLHRSIRYRTHAFALLAGSALDVRATSLRPQGRVTIGPAQGASSERTYRRWSSGMLEPGAGIRADVVARNRQRWRTAAVVGAAVIAAIVLFVPVVRRSRRSAKDVHAESVEPKVDA